MAGIFKIKDLEARKKALADQNDLCRQMLQLELRNLQIYTRRLKRKWSRFMVLKPLLSLAPLAGMAGTFLGRRQRERSGNWTRLARTAMTGWALYRRYWRPVRDKLFTATERLRSERH